MKIDHLGEILVRHGAGSNVGSIQLHRSKCTAIIKNCISEALKAELKEDLSGKKFVLIVDESTTDVSSQKLFCVAVSYISNNLGPITDFLGLIPVIDTSAETLFSTLDQELKSYVMEISDCIGFASDGASVMVGSKNSVWSRIKAASPQCVQMKCICYSLALCIQKAFAELPSNLGFLLKEIPAWFSHSALRRDSFRALFQVMNADTGLESGTSVQTPFQKLSTTRWFVRGKVMQNILVNWEELLGYFIVAEQSLKGQPDAKFKARLLKEMLNDRYNFLLLHFATPVVQEFERLNAMFQGDKPDPQDLNQQLEIHCKSLCSRIFHPSGKKKDLNEVDLCGKFLEECRKFTTHSSESTNDEDEMKSIETRLSQTKERCLCMLSVAYEQVLMRLPPSKDLFRGLSLLSPTKALSQVSKAPFANLSFPHLMEKEVEEQYRKIPFVDWASVDVFSKTGVLEECIPFWNGVSKTPWFEHIGKYALRCLIMPSSNAVIERLFSLVTCIKTKSRNRMGVECLEAIVRIRSHLKQRSKCCKNFEATNTIIDLHKYETLYPPTERQKTTQGQCMLGTPVVTEQEMEEAETEKEEDVLLSFLQ